MKKNFFKSSVSAFVLLSALSTFSPLRAMEEGNTERSTPTPYAQRRIPEDLVKILTSFEERDLQPPKKIAVSEENHDLEFDPEKPFITFPNELTEKIFSFVYEPTTRLTIQSVSPLWRSISIGANKRRLGYLKRWRPGDKSDEFMILFTHPYYFVRAHQILARKKLLYPTPEPSKIVSTIPTVITAAEFDPGYIHEYVSVLKASPHLYPFISRMFLNIDVLDMPSSALAAYVINQVPEVKAILQKTGRALAFKPAEFAALARNLENHPWLTKYFMALRLLALSGDTPANDQMSSFSWPVRDFVNFSNPSVQRGQHFMGHPLWEAYFQETNSLQFQWNAICYFPNLTPKLLTSYMDYTCIVNPIFEKNFKIEYHLLLLKLHENSGNKENTVSVLRSLSTSDLKDLVAPPDDRSSGVVSFERYFYLHPSLARTILNEGHNRVGDAFFQGKRKVRVFYHQSLLESDNTSGNKEGILNTLRSLSTSDLKELVTPPDNLPYSQAPVETYINTHSSLAVPIIKEAQTRLGEDFPQLKRKVRVFYNLSLLENDNATGNKEGILNTLRSLSTSDLKELVTPPDNQPFPIAPVETYFKTHSSLAMSIIKEAFERLGDDYFQLKQSVRSFYIQSLEEAFKEEGNKENTMSTLHSFDPSSEKPGEEKNQRRRKARKREGKKTD